MEKMYYNYPINNYLLEYIDSKNYFEITLCVYTINTNGKYPFIQYLLTNHASDNLSLPILPTFTEHSMVLYSKIVLNRMLNSDNFEDFKKDIEFNGFYEYNEKLYLFFDVTKCKINIDNSNSLKFGLIDEILNHCCICDINIDDETVSFFENNISFIYLYNEKNELYEHPVVGYVGKETHKKINFVYIFGESAKNKSAILGPYFYFTDFNNAKKNNSGFVRFALFIGKTKYIENIPNSSIDDSDIKKERLNDKSLDKNYEIQTSRISDHDGNWTNNYDSAYLGNIELDDGSFIKDGPMIVLKEYNQQVPLSCHFI